MIKFKLTILGTNAAVPAFGRITSTQALEIGNQVIIIDCGEACQIRLKEYKIKTSKINLICISHLHGDHVFGLPGLISSFSNNGRKDELTIIGPKGIKAFIDDILKHTSSHLSYPIIFKELDHSKGSINIYGSESFEISAFPMDHRITTYGYRFDEKMKAFNVKKDAIKDYDLSVEEIKLIKQGADIKRENVVIRNKDLVREKPMPRSYAYCSDTAYNPDMAKHIYECQYLYHETTYENALSDLAAERKHSTTTEAASIAKAAKVGHLITGHYSGRYRTVNHLAEEARTIFENVTAGYDGLMIEFKRPTKL